MSKDTLIIDNIITPYMIARYNAINTVLDGKLEVWFQAKTDINRHWKELPPIKFKYQFLEDHPIRVVGADVATFHINIGILSFLAKRKSDFDSIIICGWDSLTYWYTVWFCRRHGISLTLWSGSTVNEPSWRRTLFLPIIKWVVKHADHYIAYGTRARDFLIELGANTQHIPIFTNSIDVQHFVTQSKIQEKNKLKIRERYGISRSDFIFLYVGQLIERKGIFDLVTAVKALLEQGKQLQLVIVGKGPLEQQLKSELTSLPVVFVGHAEYHQLPELYVAADAFALPSHEEVWGLVVNEALASGIPVIVSDAAGCAPDLVIPGKNGYTYPSGNTEVLKETLLNMIESAQTLRRHTRSIVEKTDPLVVAKKVFNVK